MNWKRLVSLQRESAHPGEEELFALLDGELDDKRADEVREHVAGCWNCRARQTEFEQTVFAFVKGRNAALENFAQTPPQLEARLLDCLQQTAVPPPAGLARWQQWLQLSTVLQLRLSMAAAAVGLLVVAGFWLTRGVSAQELLERATQAEQNELARLVQPVTYRQVRIARRKAQQETTTVWESWREARGPRSQQRFAQAPEVQQELAHILTANQFDVSNPLSVAAFSRWRQQARQLSESVTALNGAWRLTTIVTGPRTRDAILEASLTVRRGDWHAIQQSFKVQGEHETLEYELIEMVFEVMPLQALVALATPTVTTPSLTAAPALLPTTSSATPFIVPSLLPLASLLSAAALREAEVAALFALHQAHADLGEQVEVVREDGGQIIVRGLVQTATRKEELVQLLLRIPLVSANILTLEEAAQQMPPATVAPENLASVSATNEITVTNVAPVVNAFQQRLIEQFGGRKGLSEAEREAVNARVTEFYNTVEAEASGALSEAWALRRLQERFTAITNGELDTVSRQRLEEMAGTYLARLRQRSRHLQARLHPLLSPLAGEIPAPRPNAEVPRPAKIQAVFRAVELVSQWTDQLVAGQSTAPLPQTARALLSELAGLEARLTDLEKN